VGVKEKWKGGCTEDAVRAKRRTQAIWEGGKEEKEKG
jgi:hypothetical protein